jgi:endonuclease/exonuclease/phosphatase family metal-dependent hydrolase
VFYRFFLENFKLLVIISYHTLNRRDFLKLTGLAAIVGATAVATPGCYTTRTFSLRNVPFKFGEPVHRLKVMSYNIANARGNTKDFWKRFKRRKNVEKNLDDIVRVIKKSGAELIGLQEVDFNSARTHNIEQARYIAERLNYNYISEEKYFHFPPFYSLGNAVISKYPLQHVKTHNYGGGLFGRLSHLFKGFLDVRISLPGKELDFIVTHLYTTGEGKRVDESKQLLKYLRKKSTQFILVGDFNCSHGTKPIDILEKSGLFETEHLHKQVPTYPSDKPKHSIDHIIPYKGFGIENYHTLKCGSSDHAPIVGDVMI